MIKHSFLSKKHLKKTSFLLLLPCIQFLSGCGKEIVKNEPIRIIPVKTFTVGEKQESIYDYYPAYVRSGRRVKLAFQVSGQLIRFPVKSGQNVKHGEILGELDSRDYENALKSATARYGESKTEFQRYSRLMQKLAVSVSDFEEKRRIYEVAEAEMKIAEKALADTRLTAPYDGVVAATYVDNFQNIQAKQEVLNFQSNTNIELVVDVPEKDVIRTTASLPLEQITAMFKPVAIFPALNNRKFSLSVREFETEADSSTQTYQCVLVMPAPKKFNIMAGMTALVRVKNSCRNDEESGYPVPVTAVRQDADGHSYVWLVTSQSLTEKRPVSVGMIDNDRIIVKTGLRQGEVIVIAGTGCAKNGMKVRPLEHIGEYAVSPQQGETL